MKFNFFGLKKLICTSYAGSPISHTELNDLPLFKKSEKLPYMIEIKEVMDYNRDGREDLDDIEWLLRNNNNTLTILDGDGDFRSEECIEFLKEADVVVTNPPFSLFREFVAQLMKYDKDFIIIGNQNAITYKEIFPLIKADKMWFGRSIHSGDREFRVPDDYPLNAAGTRIDGDGNRFIRVKGVRWYTNIDYRERHEKLVPYKKYTPENYPSFDNYDAINVDKTVEIPEEYDGVMGVPITFLDKYNPDQFEIVALGNSRDNFTPNKNYVNPIKHLKDGRTVSGGAINCVLAIRVDEKPDNQIYYSADNEPYLIAPYARILIRRRKNEN